MAAARKPAAKKAPEVVEETPVETPAEGTVPDEVTPDPEAAEDAPEPSAPRPPKHSLLALRLRRRITQGDHGPVVSQVQAALLAQGFDLKVTGAFGIQTARAVRQFQARVGIRPTGEVNRRTWEAIMGIEVAPDDVIPTDVVEPEDDTPLVDGDGEFTDGPQDDEPEGGDPEPDPADEEDES